MGGDSGYVKLERGKGGAGECGILSDPSYPVVDGKAPPAPPSPPSPPSPPTPGHSHYEKPPCGSDEVAVKVQGATGSVCAPSCDTAACPTDVPQGTSARPKCELQDQSSGKKYCALSCFFHGCPTGAKCNMIGGLTGICMYPDAAAAEAPMTTLVPEVQSNVTFPIPIKVDKCGICKGVADKLVKAGGSECGKVCASAVGPLGLVVCDPLCSQVKKGLDKASVCKAAHLCSKLEEEA